MTSDSAIPYLKSNSALPDAESISHLSDVEVNSTDSDVDSIIPDAELKSVIRYLKANSPSDDAESHSATPDIDSISANTEPNPGIWDFNSATSVIIENKGKNHIQVQFKTEEGRLLVILPTELQVPASEVTWSDIWQQLKLRLKAGDRLRTPNTTVHLIAQDRLLDSRQLQELAEAFSEVKLQLKCVATSRRQTAIAAVTSGYSVEQLQPETSLSSQLQAVPQPQADTLYLETTVRSGTEIRHAGTVILLGDLNPGGIVVAEGDILVWGRLRGIAHAGAGGNSECLIMALQMEPTQLRIADAVARAPEKSPSQLYPEVAHITPQGIRIARATDFSRNQLTRINQVL
ncbi:septum site-determining protein MinC [Nostocaceae cyanobacterium CENA357]|uniref:Probable septum site-determining protein MinC n=1 Tax=Atlanticothrix silvestris CENA357 TaxID=1725252 RepID=A0A8J7H7R0_9CYAN|nr:septum site-determining protein MinC [Atlanticothrix silvestris]MBH8551622.1 septum site-determining protein MinC [Atlanticothrix silvestris CENA357]